MQSMKHMGMPVREAGGGFRHACIREEVRMKKLYFDDWDEEQYRIRYERRQRMPFWWMRVQIPLLPQRAPGKESCPRP